MGRKPIPFDPNYVTLARRWTRLGWPEYKIFEKFGVSHSTFDKWKKQFPKLQEALRRGREVNVAEVEDAIFKNAKGYEVEEVKTTYEMKKVGVDGNGHDVFEKIVKEEVRTVKHMRPDTGAAAFVLKNRDSENWKDKQNVEFDNELKTNIVVMLPSNNREKEEKKDK